MNSKFRGTGVALITPFKNHNIDWASLERIIEHVIVGGVEYIVSLGTTGEAITLSTAECKEVFNFTKTQVNGRVPLVAGLFGGNNTEIVKWRLRDYDLEGFDAVLSSSPAYSKPSQEGIFQHYMALAEVSPIPIIIYNVPGRTGSNVASKTVLRLAHASDKFMAVKEASGNLLQAMEIIKDKPDDFLVLSGDDQLTLPMIAAGGDGVISVIANSHPHIFSDMVRHSLKGNLPTARKLNNLLFEVHHWLYVENNPCGIKAAMEILGLCSRDVRLPLVPYTADNFAKLKAELEKVANA